MARILIHCTCVTRAGKTTTLGILTGDLRPTTGEVYIGGYPLSDPRTMRLIGYCPQVDPLLELMNAYETLWFFGRIRGIAADVLTARVASLIKEVGLTKFADKPCGTYSGGNKRKLSLAVALIGDPRVLLLDEVRASITASAGCCFCWLLLATATIGCCYWLQLFAAATAVAGCC